MRKFPLLLIPIALALAGCSSAFANGQPDAPEWTPLAAGQSAGQTFVAEYDGLASVRFMLQAEAPASGEIRLHLRASPQSGEDLAVSSLPLSSIGGPAWHRFSFEPQIASRRQSYYAFVEILGEGNLQLGRAPGDAYLDGTFHWEGAPAEGQAAFQLTYARPWALLGLGREALHWGGFLALGLFLFTLPGWGLLAWFWPRWKELRWPEKLTVSTGVSLAIYPLLFLFTDIAGLHLGALYAWLPPLAGLAALLWANRKGLNLQTFKPARPATFPEITLLIVLVLLALTRFWAIRSLEAPMWGDAVQHTVIAQLMRDNGGLFHSWEPYAPYGSLTVQFGFSAFTAVFGWLSGLSSVKSALIVGQLLNVAAVAGLYPLAVRLGRGNAWAGVGAVLVAGLVSTMPAFYVNWGRYGQLAGQAILPAGLWLVWETLDRGPKTEDRGRQTGERRQIAICGLLSAVALAGMALAYYRMPFYFATFVAVLLLAWALPEWRGDWRRWAWALLALAAVAALAVLLLLPWMPRLMGGNLAASVERGAAVGKDMERVRAEYEVWKLWAEYFSPALLVFGLLAAAWGLLRRQWLVAALPAWVALLAAIPVLTLLRVPMTNLMEHFGIMIALYIPAGLACGWLIGDVAAGLARRRAGAALASLLVIVAALAGAWNQHDLAQPGKFGMVFRPDSRALAWIRENTPEEARFLVEGFRIYAGKSAVGSDAGWWLPLIARRQNTMPPQYALINEAPLVPGYTQELVALVALLESVEPGSPEALAALCTQGVTHVYIGQAQGNASSSRVTQLFAPADFADSPAFELLYQQDRVFVYTLRPGACVKP